MINKGNSNKADDINFKFEMAILKSLQAKNLITTKELIKAEKELNKIYQNNTKIA